MTATTEIQKAVQMVEKKYDRRMEYHKKNNSDYEQTRMEFKNACALYGISEEQYINVIVNQLKN
jgi:hypothetical protein